MSALHRVTRHAGRPLLMLPDAALDLARRALAVDPRALQRDGFARRPGAFLRKLGVTLPWSPSADLEIDDFADAPLQPIGYAPRYASAPEAEGFGWSLVEGIACLDIEGALLDRGFLSISDAMFWGYDTIAQSLREAMASPQVKAVFVRMDSPGGVVAGGLEALTAEMRTLRETANEAGKAIWVYADCAASAAYWIAAQADRIVAPAVGLVGSIGAVIVHQDVSGALKKEGVAVTAIQFGAKKTDGAWWKPLSEEAKADLQSEIDAIGTRFIADVIKGREFLGAKALLDTQAGVFQAVHPDSARAGLALGLVDAVMTEEAAFRALQKHVGAVLPTPSAPQRAPARGDASQPGAQTQPNAQTTEKTPMRKSTHARLRAALARKAMDDSEKLDAIKKILDDAEETEAEDDEENADAEGEEQETDAEGEEEEVVAEDEEPPAEDEEEEAEEEAPAEDEEEEETAPSSRKRGKAVRVNAKTAEAILDLPQAKGREKLAAKLALRGCSLAEAREFLAAAPKASRLVGNVHDPKLGPGGETSAASGSREQREAKRIAAEVSDAYERAIGKK